jgi:hypothetical protein
MIGGEWVVEHGKIDRLDIDDLICRHSAAAHRLQNSAA